MIRVKAQVSKKEQHTCDTSSSNGEDAVSHERHIKALSAEYRKVKANEGGTYGNYISAMTSGNCGNS